MERFELPVGWSWKALGDPSLTQINPKKSEVRNVPDALPITFVPMDAISHEKGVIADPAIRKIGDVRKGYTYFAENDVIFAKITPCMENGKSAIAKYLSNGIGFGSTEFHVFRAKEGLLPEWLHCLLRSKQLRNDAKKSMTGAAGQQRVPKDFLASYEVPVPPVYEQRRLTNRISSQIARVGLIRAQCEVLEKELRGILQGHYSRIIADAAWRPMGEVAPQIRRPIAVMEGQSYAELGIRSFGKGSFHKPSLSPAEIGSKRIYSIEPGDLVFNNVFAWEGAVAVIKAKDAGRVGSHRFISCLPVQGVVTTPFLYFHFTTDQGLHDLGDASPGGAGRNRTLGLKALDRIKVPVPSFHKQKIFSRLWETSEVIRGLQLDIKADLAAYGPAILAKAFKGEL